MSSFWIELWRFVLVGALTAFAGLAVWVSVGGAADLRALLRSLERRRD